MFNSAVGRVYGLRSGRARSGGRRSCGRAVMETSGREHAATGIAAESTAGFDHRAVNLSRGEWIR